VNLVLEIRMFGAWTTSLWIAAAGVKLGLLMLLFRARQAGAHPWFAAYLGLTLLRNLVLMALMLWASAGAYFYASSYTQWLNGFAIFLVALEVMRGRFAAYDLLPRQIVYRALWAFWATVLIAAAIVFFSAPRHFSVLLTLDGLERGINLLTFALFWLLYYYSELLGLSPRYLSYGITSGFVFYCTMIYLAAAGEGAGIHLPAWSGSMAFLIASGIWFASLRTSIPVLEAEPKEYKTETVTLEA
jgi:hypothetical protein